MKRILKWVGIVVAVLFVLGLLAPLAPVQPVFVLLFGWIAFPIHTLPKMTIEPAAFVVAGVALVFLIALSHGLARWLYANIGRPQAPARRWRLPWTVAVVGIVLLLFGSGICLIVTIHQTGWLVTAKEPIIVYNSRAAHRVQSTNNLRQIGLAMHNYHTDHHNLPPGGTFNEYGEMQHSWETALLPYLELSSIKPNLSLPWNHPDNAQWFKTVIPGFINPGVRDSEPTDAEGYALSHYSVNSRVFGANHGLQFKDVTDGMSNTIMAGEVKERFKPWGHPVNGRDPALGINKSPDGFGGPWNYVTNFLLMDGSVRTMSDDTDPAVLRALSTPNGGEKLPDDWGN